MSPNDLYLASLLLITVVAGVVFVRSMPKRPLTYAAPIVVALVFLVLPPLGALVAVGLSAYAVQRRRSAGRR